MEANEVQLGVDKYALHVCCCPETILVHSGPNVVAEQIIYAK